MNQLPKIVELVPVDGRASFGGKAKVVEQDGRRYLTSYGMYCMSCDMDGKNVRRHLAPGATVEYEGREVQALSATTKRHIKAFCRTFCKGFGWEDFEKAPAVWF